MGRRAGGALWCAVASCWNHRGHFRGLCGVGWGPLDLLPQVMRLWGHGCHSSSWTCWADGWRSENRFSEAQSVGRAGRPWGASGWHREGLCAQQVGGSTPSPAAELLPGVACPASPSGWASGYETLPWALSGLLGRKRNQVLVGGSSHSNLESASLLMGPASRGLISQLFFILPVSA